VCAKTGRREFIRFGAGAAAAAAVGFAGCETLTEEQAITRRKFAGLERLGPVMPHLEVKDGKLKGKSACKYVDDVIWFLRDIARKRPKSIFEHPFLAGFRKIHRETGLKVQFNLFYRTDFFYGMDEFSLADMPSVYKKEFRDNADWIKFGFHALQEFPDYPWVNSDYGDVAKCLAMIRGEVDRFAGDEMFARAVIPHWVPISKDGVRALADAGMKIVYATVGDRYAYNGNPETLPYGHSFRLENNRKPETALFTRNSYMTSLAASICGYNHIEGEKNALISRFNRYVFDPDAGMAFRDFCTRPMSCINIHSIERLKASLDAVKDAEFVGYGNHEQYFFKDYLAYQPEYMDKEMLAARTLTERGHKFVFMEELV
jgi:hypothetical protein